MLTTREVIKTFYNALLQRLKKYRGNWEQNDPTADDYIKNRPFYTDETKKIVNVPEQRITISSESSGAKLVLPELIEFVVGQTYEVKWDDETYSCVAFDINGIGGIGNQGVFGDGIDTGEPFIMMISKAHKMGIVNATTRKVIGTHTIEVTTTKVVTLDRKYLPDTIADKSEVETAKTAADNAQTTANNAQTTATNAQNIANTANTTANKAQTTANNAQNTANAAKTAAENAKIDPNSYNYCATLFSKYGEFVGWYDTMGTLEYEPKSGSFYRSWFETTPLKYEDIPFDEFICTTPHLSAGELPYSKYLLFLTKYASVNGWGIEGVAIDSQGGTFQVKTPTVDKSTGEGLFLDFLPQDYMLINSSTRNSTKKFKITVDDSGKPTFTNLSDSADSYTPTDLPPVTDSDSGKFLRVSSAGEWVAETIPNASGVSF